MILFKRKRNINTYNVKICSQNCTLTVYRLVME